MGEQYRVTFRNFRGLDLQGSVKTQVPRYSPNHMGEETMLRTGLSAASSITSHGSMLRSLLSVATGPVSTMTVAGTVPGCHMRSPFPDFTATDGIGASAGAVGTLGIGGGVYFWNKSPGGEIGLYGSVSAGIVTNIGASAGVQIALLFGPAPAVLAGDSIAVSVDIGIDVMTVTGTVYLTAPSSGVWPPPSMAAISGWTPDIIGIGFGLSVGFSALPVDISVMPSRTWTRPIDAAHPLMI